MDTMKQKKSPRSFRASSRSGQSVVEALIAIGVITTGFLGIVTLLSKSFFYYRDISDTLRANYLAVDGIEIAKNLIDHDVYQKAAGVPGAAWNACFSAYENPATGVADLALDYLAGQSGNCAGFQAYSVGTPLRFDPTVGRYSYQTTAGSYASQFARDIRIVASGTEITVSSIVSWSTGPVTSQSVNLEDHFYNWKP